MTPALGGPVVAGVDDRAEGMDALALAERLAGLDGSRLVVVAAYPYAPLSSRSLDGPSDAGDAARALDAARRELGRRDAELVAVAGSSAGRTLHEVATARDAACIVVGSSHHGPAGRLVLGGVTAETLRRAPCAVAVAPRGWAGGSRSLSRIGIAIDGSERDRSAAALGARIAGCAEPHATVATVHVDSLAHRGSGGDVVDAQVVLEGDPVDALAAYSGSLDLLVLGSRGSGRAGSVLLGGVAARLIGMARCPVIVLPSGSAAHGTLAAMGDVATDR